MDVTLGPAEVLLVLSGFLVTGQSVVLNNFIPVCNFF